MDIMAGYSIKRPSLGLKHVAVGPRHPKAAYLENQTVERIIYEFNKKYT